MYKPGKSTTSTMSAGARELAVVQLSLPEGPRDAVRVALRDGSEVLIRRLRREDAELERDFLARLSPESIEMRFFGMVKPGDAIIRRLTNLDYSRDMAFVALASDGGQVRQVGVSRYALAPDAQSCECAVTVSDAWQGRGLAVVLMRMLIDVARRRGVQSMIAIELRPNERMQELVRFLGFKPERSPDDPSVIVHRLVLRQHRGTTARADARREA